MRLILTLITFCNILGYTSLISQTKVSKIRLTEVFTGLNNPVAIERAKDNRLFIVEKSGIIKVCKPNGTIIDTFLNIRDRVTSGGERGLLGLAFAPDYKISGRFYVNYTTGGNNLETVISRFRVSQDSNKALSGTEELILTVDQPFSNHNGGNIEFGPDGYLYIGLGDGGSAGDPFSNSQNPAILLGKMLRIDVSEAEYKIPEDNPFIDNSDYRPEIWATGLRNPWKYTFDPKLGHLWIADVGQGLWEEIDFQTQGNQGGQNYGWRCYEGNQSYNSNGCGPKDDYTFPVFEYPHQGTTHCSVTGGEVYVKDTNSTMYGSYIYTDYCSGQFWATKYLGFNQFVTTEILTPPFGGFTAFGTDSENNIYVARENGKVYRIDTVDICPSMFIEATDSLVGCGIPFVKLHVDSTLSGRFEWTRNGVVIPGIKSNEITVNQEGTYDVLFVGDSCFAYSQKPIRIRENTSLKDIDFTGYQDQYCLNGAPLIFHGTPAGGVFSGRGMIDSIFDPSAAGIGNHFITYYYEDSSGCSGFKSVYIKVNPTPDAEIITFLDTLCLTDPLILLEASPMDGMFEGAGVSGNSFNPEIAGVGRHSIRYTYRPYPGCEDIDSIHVFIKDCSANNNKSIYKRDVFISPVPVKDFLKVQFGEPIQIISIQVISSTGQLAFKSTEKNNSNILSYQLNLQSLRSGMYILSIFTNQGIINRKFNKI